jgi:hypothetical protein
MIQLFVSFYVKFWFAIKVQKRVSQIHNKSILKKKICFERKTIFFSFSMKDVFFQDKDVSIRNGQHLSTDFDLIL